MSILSRDDFLSFVATPKEYDVPELGGTVHLLSLKGKDRAVLQSLFKEADEVDNSLEKILIIGLGDADGNRLFTDVDLPGLAELPIMLLQKLGSAILDHNGLSQKGSDDIEKN